ncbi:MAG: putative lipid II flippase FtsW [Lachnospiraceae bacterium]|nr:putative lipid II flippase FtsW [Lachnospiraceae bacterium]
MAAKPRSVRRKRKKVNKEKSLYFDFQLMFLVLFLVALGLVLVYSTSSYTAELKMGTSFYYLKRQSVFAIMGIVAMVIVSKIDYHVWKSFSLLAMVVSIVLLALVFVLGTASHGATRWISIAGIKFQPSEVAKIAIILFTAHMATIKVARIGNPKILLKVVAVPMVATGLIAYENLSTAIICAAIIFMIVFVTSPKIGQFVGFGIAMVVLMAIFLIIAPYRMERVQIWKHPENYERGYQTLQSLYAIGSGGIFGKGLGQSIQKMGFIPESHNDMIFSVVCEELGLFGAACVIALFIMLVWRCVVIAMSAPDLFGALIVVGVITHVSVQVLVNIAVVTNTIPPTGVPLPFISYGGTALFCLLVEIGLVLSVAGRIHIPKEY